MNANTRPVHGGYPGQPRLAGDHNDMPHTGGIEVTYLEDEHEAVLGELQAVARVCANSRQCLWPRCSCPPVHPMRSLTREPEVTCRTCQHFDTDLQQAPCFGCVRFARWQRVGAST